MNTLSTLPRDPLKLVFQNLNFSDRSSLRSVCRRFREVSNDENLIRFWLKKMDNASFKKHALTKESSGFMGLVNFALGNGLNVSLFNKAENCGAVQELFACIAKIPEGFESYLLQKFPMMLEKGVCEKLLEGIVKHNFERLYFAVINHEKMYPQARDPICLIHSIARKNLAIAEDLISRWAAVNIEDGVQPLHAAVESGYLPMVKLLVERGAEIAYYDSEKSILEYAAKLGKLEILKYLLDEQTKRDGGLIIGMTLIKAALDHGHIETFCHLVLEGNFLLDFLEVANWGYVVPREIFDPLLLAYMSKGNRPQKSEIGQIGMVLAFLNCEKSLIYLVERDESLIRYVHEDSTSLFHIIAEKGSPELAIHFIKRGAPLYHEGNKQTNPLQILCERTDFLQFSEVLSQKGVEIEKFKRKREMRAEGSREKKQKNEPSTEGSEGKNEKK